MTSAVWRMSLAVASRTVPRGSWIIQSALRAITTLLAARAMTEAIEAARPST